MEFHGFRSIREYESECARVGFTTRRVPFHKGNEKFFVLITGGPKTATSIDPWHLFTADETAEVLDGIISGGIMDPAKYMRDGLDVNYLGKLAANGYYPDNPETAAQIAQAPLPSLEIVDDGTGFAQFSLLPMQ